MKVNFIECEWIGNPRIKIAKCVDAKAQHEKMRRNTTKTNHRHKLQYTKFSVIDFVLTNKGNFLDTGPKSVCGKSFICRFRSQPQECHY